MSEPNINVDVAGVIREVKETRTAKAIDNVLAVPIEFLNTLLIPLRIANCYGDEYFQKCSSSIASKLNGYSTEELIPPAPYVAVPALQAMSYSIDSDELREMYSNLLAKAMLKSEFVKVHPGFVDIIRQLSPIDADLLNLIGPKHSHAFIDVWKRFGQNFREEMLLYFSIVALNKYDPVLSSTSLSNLERLGLITFNYQLKSTKINDYDKLKKSDFVLGLESDFERKSKRSGKISKLDFDEGIVSLTPFGRSFAEVCLSAPKIGIE